MSNVFYTYRYLILLKNPDDDDKPLLRVKMYTDLEEGIRQFELNIAAHDDVLKVVREYVNQVDYALLEEPVCVFDAVKNLKADTGEVFDNEKV